MKNVIVFFVGVIVLGAFSIQNVNAQNENIAQQIIGTWTCVESGHTWTFNSNGSFTRTYMNEGRFVVAGTHLAILDVRRGTVYFEISMSSDGNNIILQLITDRSREADFWRAYWLTKE